MSLDAIGIVSNNLEKSVQFYKIFGVDLVEAGGPDHLEGKTKSGVRIMVDSVELIKKINPSWVEPTGSGMILCFKQESAKDVNALFATVIDAG